MRSVRLAFTVALLLALGHPLAPGWTGEFRIETDVFVDDGKEPAVETLTIFSEGVVYDFLLTGVEEITVFDQQRERLVLLDTKRKVKTELTFDSLLQYVAQMKVQLSEAKREALLAEELEVQSDDAGWLTLTNGEVTYRAEGTRPKYAEAATEYQRFADWYARLNAMREGNPPPFARIRLNAELASRGVVPKTIERTIVQQRGLQQKTQTLRSQHLANWRLSQTDRKQIDRAGTYLVSFTDVPFRDYLQLPAAAAANSTPEP
ncbi:MAG: hypothetical protein MUF48_12575 [Pirellulaceae bacterium]|jgi:hypothetical protein|nr:hypothetical protein [Pirellulaceae bacterium]